MQAVCQRPCLQDLACNDLRGGFVVLWTYITNLVANSAKLQLGDAVFTDLYYADVVALLVDDPDKLQDVLPP